MFVANGPEYLGWAGLIGSRFGVLRGCLSGKGRVAWLHAGRIALLPPTLGSWQELRRLLVNALVLYWPGATLNYALMMTVRVEGRECAWNVVLVDLLPESCFRFIGDMLASGSYRVTFLWSPTKDWLPYTNKYGMSREATGRRGALPHVKL